MKIDLKKIKNSFKDYIIYLVILIIVVYSGYVAYFFYQNFYLTISDKLPLEQVIIKEKINFDLYEKTKESLDQKRSYNIDTSQLKNPFKNY